MASLGGLFFKNYFVLVADLPPPFFLSPSDQISQEKKPWSGQAKAN